MVSVCSDDLLHPEILSKETLIGILKQRQIKLDAAQCLDKEVLVDIFHRTVTPLAQREPRLNRRGKVTAKKIKRLSHDKKTFKLDEGKSSKNDTQKGGLVISANVHSSKPRLKPPPVVINKKRSIIKLNSSSAVSSSSLKKASTSPAQDGTSNTSNVIKLTTSSKSSLEGDVAKILLTSPGVVSECKKISLKRPSLEQSTSAEKSKASTTSPASGDDSPASTSPKKRKKITWP